MVRKLPVQYEQAICPLRSRGYRWESQFERVKGTWGGRSYASAGWNESKPAASPTGHRLEIRVAMRLRVQTTVRYA